ncbi:MAG: basic amino acid ABC transporter substrate-binding protein [Coriobacteriia bacterium]|nr:basic amino acid ABC transporter substrate-binding protein [Coriobacteriia bacterium]
MTKMRKLLSLMLVLALIAAVFGLVGCKTTEPEETPEESNIEEPANLGTLTPGKIIVGSDTAYPPFESVEGGKIVGFDVDLATAIGELLGQEVEFKTYNFDSLIAGLQANTEFDMVASAMTITDERAKEVNFSNPYIDSNQSLAVPADSKVASTDDFKKGDKVGVQSGTTGEKWAQEQLASKGVTVVPYENIIAAFQAMSAGDVAGIVNDIPISQNIVKDPTRNAKIVQTIETNEQYGFAFNKGNTALRDAFNGALADVISSGKYSEIYQTWFGAEPTSIPK